MVREPERENMGHTVQDMGMGAMNGRYGGLTSQKKERLRIHAREILICFGCYTIHPLQMYYITNLTAEQMV